MLKLLSIATAGLIGQPITVAPLAPTMVAIQCPDVVFTNCQWSAWVSQDMVTWWEFPQSSPENRRIMFIPGATNTYVRLVGYPKSQP